MKKYAGIIGMLIFVIITALIVLPNYQSLDLPVSKYIAIEVAYMIFFGVMGVIATALLTYSLLFDLPRKWNLKNDYKTLASLFLLSILIICIFPYAPGFIMLHNIGSCAMAILGCGLAVLLLFRLWPKYSLRMKVVNSITFGLVIFALGIIIFNHGLFQQAILLFESIVMSSLFVFLAFLILDKPKEIR